VQTWFTQLLLQQSLLTTHALDGWTHAQVPPLQNWLVQSPPAWQGPPTLLFRHVPLRQLFVVQSELLLQKLPAVTAPHVLTSQNRLQQSPPKLQGWPTPTHWPLTHPLPVPKDCTGGQPEPHATPALQQVRLAALPQGVVPAGQPQMPWVASAHAIPELQQLLPQGVVPFGQQHPAPLLLVHVAPAGQHPCPQTAWPAPHVTASPRNGRRTAAAAAATPVMPSTFSAPRRLVGRAMARDRSSKDRFTCPPARRRRRKLTVCTPGTRRPNPEQPSITPGG
jgi:hypothetical protein